MNEGNSFDPADRELAGVPLEHLGPGHAADRLGTPRGIEIIVALVVVILTLPLMLVIALVVRLDSPGPVLFFQKRLGKGAKPFTFVKFRTLHADARQRWPELYAYKYGAEELRDLKFKIDDDPRVTRAGVWLRKTSLDELPNFWNVLIGDMALAGPRPEIPEMLPYYRGDMLLKFSVRPGVTGPAQISGRGRLSFYDTVAFDIEYVRRRSLRYDMAIVLTTIKKVLAQDGGVLMAAASDPLCGKRVLVTGAGGFIGAALVHALVARGAEVTALSRRPGRLDADASGYRFVSCDLRAIQCLRDAFEIAQPELVYHLAARPDAAEDAVHLHRVIEHNIQAVANLVEMLVAHRGTNLVYGDSVKVYGDAPVPYRSDQRPEPLSSYAVSKLAGWGLLDVARRVHGFDAMAIRPTLVYGPGQAFNLFTFLIKSIQAQRDEIALDGGAQSRDPIYIDDAVEAFLQAGRRLPACSGMTLPIGGNREMSVADIARLTVRLLKGKQSVVLRPTSQRPTEMLRSWCDNAEASVTLGWTPTVSLETGILRTAAALAAASVPFPAPAPAPAPAPIPAEAEAVGVTQAA